MTRCVQTFNWKDNYARMILIDDLMNKKACNGSVSPDDSVSGGLIYTASNCMLVLMQ